MAEATGLRNNALPYPVYGAPWGVAFPILDADGDPVASAASLDSEVSKNGDTPADCTNEATEIGGGMYYLLLTATEMTADVVTVVVKTSTAGAKTTPLAFYPRKLVPLRSGTSAGGDTAYITLDASAGANDDTWNGCLCVATIDGNVEARIITDYTGSNQRAAVTPAWNVAPDADDTFIIYLPEGMQRPVVNTLQVNGTAQTARDLGASVLLSVGTGTGQVNLSSGKVPATIAAGDLANDSITAAALAADAAAEIADAVWDEASTGHTDAGKAGAQLWTDIDAILVDTGELQTDWTNGGRLDLIVDGILEDTGTTLPGTLTAISGYVDCLPASWVVPMDAAGVRTAVGLASANLDTQLADLPTVAEFEARSIVSADYFVVTDYTAPPAVADIADAVWDEALAGHAGAGSAGAALSAAGAAGDPWGTTLPGAYGAGTAGYIIGTFVTGNAYTRLGAPAGESIAADLAAVKSDTAATLVDTNELQADFHDGGRLDLLIDSIVGYVDCLPATWVVPPTAAEIKTAIEATGSHLALILEDTGTTIPATLTAIAGATFDTATDSLEALRNRGDVAWAVGTVSMDVTSITTGD